LPFYIILIASARSEKIRAFYIYSGSHGANIDPKIEKISRKQKNRSELGKKTLKIGTRKKTYMGSIVF
jgi:hypothetical protein